MRVTRMLPMLGAALIVAGSAAAGPEISISETEFIFGLAPQNAKVTHTFWIHSIGTEAVNIERIQTGCGCTKAPLSSNTIAPGDSVALEIIFETRRYTREIVKTPTIFSNAQGQNKVRISTTVYRQPDSTYPIVARPYKLDISQFGDKVRDRMSFDLRNVSDVEQPITILSVPSEVAEFSVPKSIPSRGTVSAEFVLTEEAVGQEFEKSITLQIGDTRFSFPLKRELRMVGGQKTLSASPSGS